MIIYIAYFQFENDQINLGAFSSREKANQAIANYQAENPHYIDLFGDANKWIDEMEVDKKWGS